MANVIAAAIGNPRWRQTSSEGVATCGGRGRARQKLAQELLQTIQRLRPHIG
ncbi:MAG TPA: hypothetical protein VKM72_17085 [Thermoanaerobaculia bacterium]|nr:hypothetical protein [Thermoanaerobaculia bacterium]